MIADIVQRVQLAHDKGELPTMKINVMSINAWLEDSDIITPAEIGIVQFNLEQGILKVLDQLVDPGVIPKGYRGDMKVISDKFHKIWLDNPDLSDDYEGIINAIQDFMKRDTHSLIERAAGEGITVEGRFQPGKDLIEEQTKRRIENRNQDYLPVFVMPGVMMERCIRCMDWLAVKAQVVRISATLNDAEVNYLFDTLHQVPCEFTFFELPRLFYEILRVLSSNRTFRNISVPTLTIAEAHLNKDVLLYTPGVSCR